MRLIDADALKKRFIKRRDEIAEERKYGWEWEYNAFNGAILLTGCEAVENTIDAVPVIRCKDCKHHQGHNCDRLYGFQDAFTFMDDDYCSKAERKEA